MKTSNLPPLDPVIGCRHQFQDGKHCRHCGVSIDILRQHQRDELLRFALADTVDDSWSTTLRTCLDLITAINGGATLVIAGPDVSAPGPVARTFGATLESRSGARCANAYSIDLRSTLVELMREWQQLLDHPSSHESTIVDGTNRGKQ